MKTGCFFAALGFVFALVVCTEGACCGRGRKGFCKDCTVVHGIFSRGQKCCGSGSGRGYGCNAFCCNCGSCRTGISKITYHSGWWLKARYSCRSLSLRGDGEVADPSEDILETRATFAALDADEDNSLSPDEFYDGLRQHLNLDIESSYSLAADWLDNKVLENEIQFLDDGQRTMDYLNDDNAEGILSMIRTEFLKMDANENGVIEAKEFDKDL